MADNTVLGAPASPGDTMATKDVSGVKHQRSLLETLVAGVPTDVSLTAPVPVAGAVAHDAVDSGLSVKAGGIARGAMPAAVSAGDRADVATDLFGRLLFAQFDPSQVKSVHTTYTSQQSGPAGIVLAPTSGKKLLILSVTIASKSTTAGTVTLWFGAAGDTTYTQGTDKPLETVTLTPTASATPGLAKSYPVPISANAADDNLKITTSAALNLDVTVHYVEV